MANDICALPEYIRDVSLDGESSAYPVLSRVCEL